MRAKSLQEVVENVRHPYEAYDPADEYDIPLMAELIKEICRK